MTEAAFGATGGIGFGTKVSSPSAISTLPKSETQFCDIFCTSMNEG
jgi:hypothetical protein